MLKKFKNWLIENNYKINTAKDYEGKIERLCKKENITLDTLIANIVNILSEYETGDKYAYGNRSHTSVKQALRRFNKFLSVEGREDVSNKSKRNFNANNLL